jgi:hypothetical protein
MHRGGPERLNQPILEMIYKYIRGPEVAELYSTDGETEVSELPLFIILYTSLV